MAFDAVPGGDPRGPWCPKCGQTILPGQTWTIMHSATDPYGDKGVGGRRWHSECARPYWDTMSGLLESLKKLGL
jgi:hypothetical protein